MARKPARKAKGQKTTPSKRKAGAGARAAARSGAGARRTTAARRKTGRKTAPAKASKTKGRRKPGARSARPIKNAKAGKARRQRRRRRSGSAAPGASRRWPRPRRPAARCADGPTRCRPSGRPAPRPAPAISRRAPGTRARAQAPARSRGNRPESALQPEHGSPRLRRAHGARHAARRRKSEHTETSPAITGGDVDADWEDAYAVGDEAPGGDNPTPDQDRVDDIGTALGVAVPGQRRAQGRRQDHRARQAPLGARSRVSRKTTRSTTRTDAAVD